MFDDTLKVPRGPSAPRSFSRAYWDATRERRLLMQFDSKVGKYQFPPRATSIHTGRRSLEWREVSGRGEVFSYTIARRAPPPFAGHEPFLIALVVLDEGVSVMANLVGLGEEEPHIGMRVVPFWAPLPDGTNLLMFQPDGRKRTA